MFKRQLFRQFYLATLSAIAFFMSLSVWLLTFFIITLAIIWIADGGLMRISEIRKRNKYILIFTGTFLVYLLWMINTSNIVLGLNELMQKLPFLVLPLVIGLSDPLDKREIKTVLSFFIAGVVLSSVTGLILFAADKNVYDAENIRKISLFIPYVRLAEMTNMAIVVSVFYFLSDPPGKRRYFYLAAAIWLIFFLFVLISVTGILLFISLLFIAVFLVIIRSKNTLLKISFISVVLLFLASTGIYISHEINSFYNKCTFYTYPLKDKTNSGNPYLHIPERKDIENGNPVWIYISETELRKEWNLRSNINYDSSDLRKQKLSSTLIRYLASMGLTKDSSGMAALNERDIKYIENGITNRLFTEGKHLKSKIYEIIWQIDFYRNGGNPSGHSVTQRIEFLKTGLHCLAGNFVFGTGTGDLEDEINSQYIKDKSKLNLAYRYLPHNQYLTILVSFGITGFLIICFSVIFPVIRLKACKSILFNMFFLIILLSMLGEDTLETHTGITFFAYFYSLLIFGNNKEELKNIK
jgi:O-antigen ligase